MKRFHVHVSVDDLEKSVRFYSSLFGREPSVAKPDYAKWMLDEPRINFAISDRGGNPGVNHLGFQLDDAAELESMRAHLDRASENVLAEPGSECCYAKSNKYWVQDPSGIAWETFRSLSDVPIYGRSVVEVGQGVLEETEPQPKPAAACCAPTCCN